MSESRSGMAVDLPRRLSFLRPSTARSSGAWRRELNHARTPKRGRRHAIAGRPVDPVLPAASVDDLRAAADADRARSLVARAAVADAGGSASPDAHHDHPPAVERLVGGLAAGSGMRRSRGARGARADRGGPRAE